MKDTNKMAVERQRKINREHRRMVEEQKNKPTKPVQRLSDEELVDRFLSSNPITVIPTLEDNGDRLVNIKS